MNIYKIRFGVFSAVGGWSNHRLYVCCKDVTAAATKWDEYIREVQDKASYRFKSITFEGRHI
jgi:hypothetical protein